MKTVNKIITLALLVAALAGAGLLQSCDDDDTKGGLYISAVYLYGQNYVGNTTPVTEAGLGTLLRLEGNGFKAARGIYVNGTAVTVNPNYVTNTNLIMSVPSDAPVGNEADEADRNKIRIVTDNGEYSYDFQIKAAAPSISGISHTMPRSGDKVDIYGSSLREMESITFPGGHTVTADNFTVNADYTKLTCIIPNVDTPGYMTAVSENGTGYSRNYLNRKNCIFVSDFSWDNGAYGGGSNISVNQTDPIPATGDYTKSPDIYRQVPAENNVPYVMPTLRAEYGVVGGFWFYFSPAIDYVVANSAGAVTLDMSCTNLALEIDFYFPMQWKSGFFRFSLGGGTSATIYDYAPWAVLGDVQPIDMEGWQTISFPLSSFSGATSTLSSLKALIDGEQGSFMFYNDTFTDIYGTSYESTDINNFQLSFSNFRIVPYETPEIETDDSEDE